MMRQLLGHELLPWEAAESNPGSGKGCDEPLPILHDAVLSLLDRDPERRMSVAAFSSACRRLNKSQLKRPRTLT